MAGYSSPYGYPPGGDYYYDKDYASPSPTPSPQRPYYFDPKARPATRAHFRGASNDYSSPRPPTAFSPRFDSHGRYGTANVSASRSTRKNSFSGGERPKRDRRHSHSYYRASDSHGESDEDEYIQINGITYVLPARSKSKRHRDYYYTHVGGHATDRQYYEQYPSDAYAADTKDAYSSPNRFATPDASRRTHARRGSTSAPQRPQTARPSSSHKKQPAARKATEADAKKYRIPAGYSLKNWDPTEEPIMLLGSVFDANSLGKWIYDWTVYHHGPATPIADMAGDLWLLLIQLSGKVKRAEECFPRIRTEENREMVDDFIKGGERLMDKLRKLLKTCEAPMLTAGKKKDSQLSKNAGIVFVDTLFGRDKELDKTEKLMQSVRLWMLRFDANCEEILQKPSK